MSDRVKSYEVQTSAIPTALGPVRLYTTGSNHKRVVRATGADDHRVVGIALNAPQTQGMGISLAVDRGYEFNGYVNTTVSAGDKLKCGPGGVFEAADAQTPTTAQEEPRYTVEVLKARTNLGATWLSFQPREVV